MGYMRHHTIVVAGSEDQIKQAHVMASEIFPDQCSNIVGPLTNGCCSFFVAPDGSKEGWPESEQGDERREEFIIWMRSEGKSLWLSWVCMQFGDDNYQTVLIDHSDRGK